MIDAAASPESALALIDPAAPGTPAGTPASVNLNLIEGRDRDRLFPNSRIVQLSTGRSRINFPL